MSELSPRRKPWVSGQAITETPAGVKEGIVDGAIFVYANGTNPELGVLLECDDKGWSYGVARLSAAESKVELDGKEVASFPLGDFGLKGRGNYVSTSHPLTATK